jgi:hypothetical protein
LVLRPQINMYFKTCTHTKRLPQNNTQIKILNLEILKGCYLLNLVICCLGMSSLEQLFVVICLKIICSKWQGAVLTFDEGTNLIWRCWYDLYLPKAIYHWSDKHVAIVKVKSSKYGNIFQHVIIEVCWE